MTVKRIISAITGAAMLVSMTSILSGCSMKEFFTNEKSSEPSAAMADGNISKGEWLAMVNDAFGMQVDETSETGELDTARKWGVIGADEEIDSDAPVDDRFITSTLVRAAGYAGPDSSDQDIINAAVEHGIISDPDTALTDPGQAIDSLNRAHHSWSNQTFEEHFDVQLADNVYNFTEEISTDDIKISEGNIIIPSQYAGSLSKDFVYILPKEAGNGKGGAYKVVSISDNGDGTSTVKSIPAKAEEVYRKIDVSGQFKADMSSFEPANENVRVVSGSDVSGVSNDMSGARIMPLGYSGEEARLEQLGSDEKQVELEMELGDATLGVSLKDIVLDTDVDWDFSLKNGLEVNKIYMAVDYTTELSIEYEGEKSTNDLFKDKKNPFEKVLVKDKYISEPSISIGKFAVYICPGVSVNLRVNASVDVSGEYSVTVETENSSGFELTSAGFRPIDRTELISNEVVLTGELGLYANGIIALSLDYVLGEVDLLSLKLKMGPTLKAELKLYDAADIEKAMICADINGYLKIELSLMLLDEEVMEELGIDNSITLVEIDEKTSPIVWHRHCEYSEASSKFVRTPGDVCTVEDSEEAVTTAPATIPVGIFELENSYLAVAAGSSAKIGLKSLPSGYTPADLVWSSSDPSAVAVDENGNIKTASSGSAIIVIKTRDGKYTASCAVNIITGVSIEYDTTGYTDSVLAAA